MDENGKILITQLPFAQLGVGIGDQAWLDRMVALRKDLDNDLPTGKLRASELKFEFEPSKNGVRVLVYMVRTNQLSLAFSSRRQPNDDAFTDEVALIREAQKQLPERYEHALKSSIDPRNEPQVISHRKKLWNHRNDGHIWLPSKPEGEKFEFSPPPQFMPHSPEFRLQFKVMGMYKRDCRIVILNVLTSEVMQYLQPKAGRVQKVFRYDHALGEHASREFASSIDRGALLEATGQIAFSWVDSSVERISLTGLPFPLQSIDHLWTDPIASNPLQL